MAITYAVHLHATDLLMYTLNDNQIFLLTDVLFAQAKYDYHMQHGLELKINGKEGQLVLE